MREKRYIITVISARASFSRIKTALLELNKKKNVDLGIVLMASAASNTHGNVIDQVKAYGLRIDGVLDTLSSLSDEYGQTLTTSSCISALSKLLWEKRPDAVITIADRYETIATAISASYLNIPLIHIQGGEVTGNIDEKVRHAITKLADIHLPSTEEAGNRLEKMGESRDSIFVTGCPSCDIAEDAMNASACANEILHALGIGNEINWNKESYIVVLQHSVTDEVEEAAKQIEQTFFAVKNLNLPVLWIGNNPDAGSKAIRNYIAENILENSKSICFANNIPNEEFLVVLRDCKCIIGNSSVGIRECSYMGVPSVNIGSRQQGRLRGFNVEESSPNKDDIIRAYNIAIMKKRQGSFIYGDGHAGKKIADIISSVKLTTKKRMSY